MELLKLLKAYPGNSYSQTITLAGVADRDSITVRLRHSKEKGPVAPSLQPTVTTTKTPGASSTDVTFSWETTKGLPFTGWLEISADGQVVRAGTLTITYQH